MTKMVLAPADGFNRLNTAIPLVSVMITPALVFVASMSKVPVVAVWVKTLPLVDGPKSEFDIQKNRRTLFDMEPPSRSNTSSVKVTEPGATTGADTTTSAMVSRSKVALTDPVPENPDWPESPEGPEKSPAW
jgi:hypothetical protein